MGGPPERTVRVPPVAESRLQRLEGELSVQDLKLASPAGTTDAVQLRWGAASSSGKGSFSAPRWSRRTAPATAASRPGRA